MANDTYRRIEDDEIVVVDMDEPWIKVACCDCGLIHSWTFGLTESEGRLKLEISIDRLERCTAQKRRGGNVDLITDEDSKWKLVRR
jgi:hypothetical protein